MRIIGDNPVLRGYPHVTLLPWFALATWEVHVAASGSPTVRRRRLAAELRRLRGARKGSAVAEALGWSPAKISRYELGRTNFPLDELGKLLDFYRVPKPRRAQLLALAEEANLRGWWEDYADVLNQEYMEFIALEAEASSIGHWEGIVVPGLLQTEEYARQLNIGYQSAVPTPPRVLERLVRVRMIRQKLLARAQPPQLSAVIEESVLLRRIGDRDVMNAQLKHLAEVAELPNVEVRVLPLDRDTPLVADSFVIFGFGDRLTGDVGELADVVSTESLKSELYVEGEETDTYMYRLVLERMKDASLSVEDSRRLILHTADRLWK
jgi:transcriptional regulator with XRE-family HTH domain